MAECDPHYANPKKDSVLLMAAGGDGFDDALGYYYQNLMKHLGWKELGQKGGKESSAALSILGKICQYFSLSAVL